MDKKDKEKILAEEYKSQIISQGYDDVRYLSEEELAQMNPYTEDLDSMDLRAYDINNISAEDLDRLEEINKRIDELNKEIESCQKLEKDPKTFHGELSDIRHDKSVAERELLELRNEYRQIMRKYESGNRKVL